MRVAYLDLDGTLLGPDGIGAAARAALTLLAERAVPFVLVSGRTQERLEPIAAELGAAGVLAELGALEAGFPTAPGQSVHQAIAATGVPAALLAREPGLSVHPDSTGREGGHVLLGRASAGAGAFVRRQSRGQLVLADNGASHRPHRSDAGARVLHLVPAGAGKDVAVARDLARRGADPARCLAVGDSASDLAMGRAVGRVAIVANGAAATADPVLARAPWVTRGAYGEGVLEAVREWLGGATAGTPDGATLAARASLGL